jgi:choloylglycine hydrolase
MNGLGHGKDRYQILDDVLSFRKNVLTEQEAMNLLETVSQPETEESTSMTQWSVLYDLTDLSAQVAIRRDFSKIFKFTLDDISGTAQ